MVAGALSRNPSGTMRPKLEPRRLHVAAALPNHSTENLPMTTTLRSLLRARLAARALALVLLAPLAALAIEIDDAWVRQPPPGAPALAAFMQIRSAEGDRLLAARSDAAERVEIHTHIEEDGLMKMREIPSLDIPAGETVSLRPGGLHIMLIGPNREVKAGDRVQLELDFDKAGTIQVEAEVRDARRMMHGR